MEIAILFGVFVVLLVLGVPIAFSIAAASLATVFYLGVPPVVVVQQVSSGFNKVSLVAEQPNAAKPGTTPGTTPAKPR